MRALEVCVGDSNESAFEGCVVHTQDELVTSLKASQIPAAKTENIKILAAEKLMGDVKASY